MPPVAPAAASVWQVAQVCRKSSFGVCAVVCVCAASVVAVVEVVGIAALSDVRDDRTPRNTPKPIARSNASTGTMITPTRRHVRPRGTMGSAGRADVGTGVFERILPRGGLEFLDATIGEPYRP